MSSSFRTRSPVIRLCAVTSGLLTLLVVDGAIAARPAPISSEQAKYFSLESAVVMQDFVTAERQPSNITFSKCVYRLTHADRKGEYYTGDKGCFQLVNFWSDGKSTDGQGGLWIPKNPKKPPRLYMVVGTPDDVCGNLGFLNCQLSKLEDGRFKLMPGKLKAGAFEQVQLQAGEP